MQYTNYVILNAVIAIVFFLFLAGAFISIAGPAGFGLALLIGIVILFGFCMSIAWAHRAVTEFNGSPFPGIWGVLGFDIEPDDVADTPEFIPSVLDTPQSGEMQAPSVNGSPVGATERPEVRSRLGCDKCGAVTEGDDSRFCRMCGSPFPPATR
jgi:hypothetical protein